MPSKKIAVLFSNVNYTQTDVWHALPDSRNDAHLLAEKLRDEAFFVSLQHDADKSTMQAAIRDAARHVDVQTDVALFHFSGYGVQMDNGQPMLISVEAREKDGSDAVDLYALFRTYSEFASQNTIFVVILDISRHIRGLRVEAWTTSHHPNRQFFIIHACRPGKSASGHASGCGSLTRAVLLHGFRDGTLFEIFEHVRNEVKAQTRIQEPWLSSSCVGLAKRTRNPLLWCTGDVDDLRYKELEAKLRRTEIELAETARLVETDEDRLQVRMAELQSKLRRQRAMVEAITCASETKLTAELEDILEQDQEQLEAIRQKMTESENQIRALEEEKRVIAAERADKERSLMDDQRNLEEAQKKCEHLQDLLAAAEEEDAVARAEVDLLFRRGERFWFGRKKAAVDEEVVAAEMKKAATKIQSLKRGNADRQRVNAIKREKEAELVATNEAATKIQSVKRGNEERKRVNAMKAEKAAESQKKGTDARRKAKELLIANAESGMLPVLLETVYSTIRMGKQTLKKRRQEKRRSTWSKMSGKLALTRGMIGQGSIFGTRKTV